MKSSKPKTTAKRDTKPSPAEIKERAATAASLAAEATLLLQSGISIGDAAKELGVRPSDVIAAYESALAILDECARREWQALEACGGAEHTRELLRIVLERRELLGAPQIQSLGIH